MCAEQNGAAPRDAFTDLMASARQQPGRAELAHQSLGRAVSPAEQALAEALMEVYAGGVSDPEGLAAALAERGVAAPVSGRTDWDAGLLEEELRAANESLDAAYQQNGFGA